MESKITIRLRNSVIQGAKQYAHSHKTSLSRIIENYLESITNVNQDQTEITPLVESLSGVIQLDKDFNYKEHYTEYLIEKYK